MTIDISLDDKLDAIYDSVDELLRAEQMQSVDDILAQLDVAATHTDLLLGYLTATLPAKDKLPARTAFFDKVEKIIAKRGDNVDGLLTGLR